MPDVKYASHTGESVTFAENLSIGTAAPIRGGCWSFEMDSNQLRDIKRDAAKQTISIMVEDREQLERLQYLADIDMAASKPGTLDVDGWQTRAYITATKPKTIHPNIITLDAEVILLDTWSRSSRVTGQLTNHGALPADFKAIITGPATNPSFTIAGNRYQLDYEIPAGATVEIQSRYKTVQYQQGSTYRNLFQYAHRENGANMFAGIPHGTHAISKSGSWDLNLTIYENRGSLPWTL